MNVRDRPKKKAIKTKNTSIWNQFRKLKNQVNQEIKSAKKAYYNNAFNHPDCAGDQRKTWKTINELTSRKSNKTEINELQYQGQKTSSKAEVSELLNTFFVEIGPSLSRNVANVDTTYEEFLCATTNVLKRQQLLIFCLFFQNFVTQRLPDWIKSQLNC